MTYRPSPDVAVIGGGLLGWSVAYRLAKAGVRTTVIDRGDEGFATQAGAGIIAPGASFRSPAPFFPLAAAAMRYYPKLLVELLDDGAEDTGYKTVGALFVARDIEEAARLPETITIIEERRQSGLGNIGDLTLLTGSEARELFPPLAELPAAIHMSAAARVDGRRLRNALRRVASRRLAQHIEGSASIRIIDHRAIVVVDDRQLSTGSVVIAGGAWSSTLGDQCSLTIPVYPQ